MKIPREYSTLIIGCGIRQVKQIAEKAVAIDISQEYLDKAKEIRPDNLYVKASVEKLPFPEKTFRKVIFTHVLEHVDNPKKAISEIYRILAPGGVLYLAVPSKEYEDFLFRHNSVFKKATMKFHKNHYDKGSLSQCLDMFKKVDIKEIRGKGIMFWYLWGKFISAFNLEKEFYIEECGQIHSRKSDWFTKQFSRCIALASIVLSHFFFKDIVSEYRIIAEK
jgi:ubiquinone/menaquinone biosynthesis C-methylase UbiE